MSSSVSLGSHTWFTLSNFLYIVNKRHSHWTVCCMSSDRGNLVLGTCSETGMLCFWVLYYTLKDSSRRNPKVCPLETLFPEEWCGSAIMLTVFIY